MVNAIVDIYIVERITVHASKMALFAVLDANVLTATITIVRVKMR